MPFIAEEFQYMPPGSYSIWPDRTVHFREDVTADLKERFLQDLERLKQETQERQKRGDYSGEFFY